LTGRADEEVPQTCGIQYDPAQITAKALLCFNNKYVSNMFDTQLNTFFFWKEIVVASLNISDKRYKLLNSQKIFNTIGWFSDANQTEFGASLLLRSNAHRVPYVNFMFLVVKPHLFPCFSSIRVLRVFISLLY
jgi:hypothetical protein